MKFLYLFMLSSYLLFSSCNDERPVNSEEMDMLDRHLDSINNANSYKNVHIDNLSTKDTLNPPLSKEYMKAMRSIIAGARYSNPLHERILLKGVSIEQLDADYEEYCRKMAREDFKRKEDAQKSARELFKNQ